MAKKDELSIADELLKQAQWAMQKADKFAGDKKKMSSAPAQAGETEPEDEPDETGIRGKWRKFCRSAFNTAAAAYRKTEPVVDVVAYPIVNWAWPVARYAGQKWWNFFVWSAWKPDAETGEVKFSRTGAAHALLATAATGTALAFATPVALRFGYEASMSMTERTQYMFTHGSETVTEGETYSIRTSPVMPVTEKNSLYLHAERDLFYGIWTPENLTVPQETCWGKVTYTGFRVKILGWYPEVKSVEVTPLSKLPPDHDANRVDYTAHEPRWWWEGEEKLNDKGQPADGVKQAAAAPQSSAAPAP